MNANTPETEAAINLASDPDGAREVCILCEKLELERNALKAAVVEFMEIADDVADTRHGFTRFLELADELDERIEGILPDDQAPNQETT